MKKIIILSVFFIFVIGLSGCPHPAKTVPPPHIPKFTDKGSKEGLITALEQHISFLAKLSPHKKIRVGNNLYPASWMLESCRFFLQLVRTAPAGQLAAMVQKNFDIYPVSGGKNGLLVTGYYEPLLTGSLTPKSPFIYPLYAVPDNLIINRKGEVVRKTASGLLRPYWSRREIEEKNLLRGYELVYLKDPVDAFSLHIQGSGKIRLEDGSIRSIRYAGSNGLEYRSIGKLLVDRGIMSLKEVSMPKIRKYLAANPKQLKNILYHNQRYIFFAWAKNNRPPLGSTGVMLTPERSIAIDRKVLPTGAVAYLSTRRPVIDRDGKITSWQPFERFMLPQDSGSAIKGEGRIDIFWGSGEKAKLTAGTMHEQGRIFFLVKKGYKSK
ncbi:MAG: transglycosylase [Deltaproteobacteria bacterium]|nr:MAG: transglycosylase [Deltaproteobacteria bacterium]